MNSTSLKKPFIAMVLGSCVIGSVNAAETKVPNRPPMRKAPTNEDLVLQLRKQEQERASRPAVTAPPSQDVTTIESPNNLMSRSEVLCYGGALTLVPKRAVLQYPEKYADRLKAIPGSNVLVFSDFYAANKNWITTYEISRAQAQGKEPLPEDARASMSKTGNLIVATFQGNPIELMPPANPTPETAGTAPQSSLPQP